MRRKKRSSRRRKRSPGNKLIPALALIVVLAVGGLVFSFSPTGFLVAESEDAPYYGTIEEALAESTQLLPTDRPDYLPEEVYENLPPFPEDFYYIDAILTFQRGILDLPNLGPEYYLLPEFYPTWESLGVELTANPDRNRSTIWGWGAYPADQGVETIPGDTFQVATFFHTSWTVQSFQGMELIPVFPGTGTINGVTVSSPNSEDYFTVTLDPNLILLGPAFPRFDREWSHKIVVTVDVAENTPPGDYLLGIDPRAPPQEASREWALAHKLRYVDAGTTGVGRPYFQLLVTVFPPQE